MGNRFVLGENTYTTKALGGGRFDVLDRKNARVGAFAILGGVVEVEDEGVDDARPIVAVATKWVAENLSSPLVIHDKNKPTPPAPVASKPAPPEPQPLHEEPASNPDAAEAALADPEHAVAAHQQLCRLGLHKAPDVAGLARAKRHMEWLRQQAGVTSAYLTQEPATNRVISVVVYASREAFANMRYLKPPPEATPLEAVKVEQLLVVG